MLWQNFQTNKIRKAFFVFCLIAMVTACSSAKSGRYVRIGHPYNLQDIAHVYQVGMDELHEYNPQKNFAKGEWIFVPVKSGILSNSRVPSSLPAGSQNFDWPYKQKNIRVSSDFGYRGFEHHDGIDLPAPRKSKIFAAGSGRVITASRLRGYGKVVIIDHGSGVLTLYGHNSSNLVRVGEWIKKGQPVGLVGATGKATGNHVHFEVRIDGKAVDPLDYLPDSKNLVFQ